MKYIWLDLRSPRTPAAMDVKGIWKVEDWSEQGRKVLWWLAVFLTVVILICGLWTWKVNRGLHVSTWFPPQLPQLSLREWRETFEYYERISRG
jgi:hypothetical protein